MPSPLDGMEGAFKESPSVATAQAWLDCAMEAYKNDEIDLRELRTIGTAVRTWARANKVAIGDD